MHIRSKKFSQHKEPPKTKISCGQNTSKIKHDNHPNDNRKQSMPRLIIQIRPNYEG